MLRSRLFIKSLLTSTTGLPLARSENFPYLISTKLYWKKKYIFFKRTFRAAQTFLAQIVVSLKFIVIGILRLLESHPIFIIFRCHYREHWDGSKCNNVIINNDSFNTVFWYLQSVQNIGGKHPYTAENSAMRRVIINSTVSCFASFNLNYPRRYNILFLQNVSG